jgi:DNA-binding transcriptional regulator YhcF (GntR family)
MSRYDIADFLGISVETVSRALTELKRRGSIKPTSTRRIQMVNRPRLAPEIGRKPAGAPELKSAVTGGE